MSDPTIDMNTRASRGSIPFILFFALIIVVQIWREPLAVRIVQVWGGDYETFEQTEKLASTAITVLSAGLLSLLFFFTELNLHNFIDGVFFKVRKSVGAIIKSELVSAATTLGIERPEEILNNSQSTMRIFYHFANNQEALRNRAFMLWGRYFQYLYVIVFGFFALLFTTITAVLSGLTPLSAAMPIVVVMFLIIYSISIWTGVVPKIKELPQQQVEEIRIHTPDEFRNEIEQRRPASGNSQNAP